MEGHRLRVLENRVLRRIFRHRREGERERKWQEGGENCMMIIICILYQIRCGTEMGIIKTTMN
jgi:hypothetical protein